MTCEVLFSFLGATIALSFLAVYFRLKYRENSLAIMLTSMTPFVMGLLSFYIVSPKGFDLGIGGIVSIFVLALLQFSHWKKMIKDKENMYRQLREIGFFVGFSCIALQTFVIFRNPHLFCQ